MDEEPEDSDLSQLSGLDPSSSRPLIVSVIGFISAMNFSGMLNNPSNFPFSVFNRFLNSVASLDGRPSIAEKTVAVAFKTPFFSKSPMNFTASFCMS